jgi:hypothetical protein
MVVSPLKPSAFHARVPAAPDPSGPIGPAPDTIIVSVGHDRRLVLNLEDDLGSVEDPRALTARLKEIFDLREADRSNGRKGGVGRLVFLKAPRGLDYGSVAKTVDAVKLGGAEPIALQLDHLDAR